MDLKNVEITENNDYRFEFEQRFSEENIKKTTTVLVERTKPSAVRYESGLVKAAKLQEFIIEQVRDLCIYIADKEHYELFYKMAEFIAKSQELPINVKSVGYPGSALILMEYGILGIDDESVKKIELAVMNGLSAMTHEEDFIEEVKDEKEPEEDVLPEGEEPFPFGGISGDFIEDGAFSLGEVEEEEGNG